MFLTSENYRQVVSKVIDENQSLSIAVAYWGRDAEKLLLPASGKQVRLICNLTSGGTNPAPIEKLLGHKDISVRQLDNLHAKVVVGESNAIIGSANFSTNGLWFEGEDSAGLTEAGIYTDDSELVANAQAWFDRLWDSARGITAADLEAAQKRRDILNGLRPPKSRSLMDAPISDLKGRRIQIAIWRNDTSEKADEAFEGALEKVSALGGRSPESRLRDKFSFFEGWDSLTKEGYIISVYFGKRGKLDVEDAWKRWPDFDEVFTTDDGLSNSIQVVQKQHFVYGMLFESADREKLRMCLKPQIDEIWAERKNDECVIKDLCEVLERGRD